MEISLYPAYNAISKMIYPDPELRRDIMCIGGTSQWPATLFRGIDQWGERYGYILVDPIGGAIGAFSIADGINTGGQARTPICQLPNIEHTEQSFPVLFLYRKELTDSGGAGKYRGGLSAESCFIPHNTDVIIQDTLSSGNATPTSTGMMGGYPASTNAYTFVRNSNVFDCIDSRQMPEDAASSKARKSPCNFGRKISSNTRATSTLSAGPAAAASAIPLTARPRTSIRILKTSPLRLKPRA